MIPKYSSVQKLIIKFLYNPKESITIYTEDKESDQAFYKLLFSRLDIGNVKINDIIQLGPKSEVIERSIESMSSKIPSIFIVDGDIKLMSGQSLETSNLIAHDRYCIENFLCCEEGIVNYLHVKLGGDKELIKQKLDFENFILNNGKLILELYYRYSISYELNCGCSFKKIDDLYNSPGRITKVDSNKIQTEIELVEKKIKEKLKSQGIRAFLKEFERRLENIKSTNPLSIDTILKVVSGKDQLLPLLIKLKINELDVSSRNLDKDQVKRLLAEKINLGSMDRIKNKILNIVNT